MNSNKALFQKISFVQTFAQKNRQTLTTFADQFMVSGANFIIGILAARLLGITDFGQFTLILMLVTLASIYQESLLSIPMMTVVGKAFKRSENYFSAVASWGIVLAIFYGLVVSATLSVVFMLHGDPISYQTLIPSFFATVGMNINQNIRRIFYVRHQTQFALILDSLRFGLFFMGMLGLYLFVDTPVIWHVMTLIAVAAFASTLPFLKSMLKARRTKRLMVQVIKRHWPIGSWYILMTIVSMGQDTFIWIILKVMLGDSAVGGLRVGQYLLGITHFILMGMENFVPKTAGAEYEKGGIRALKDYLIKQNWFFGFVTGALILMIAIPAEFWLYHVFGKDYVQFSGVLRLYAISYALIFMRELWNVYLRTIEKTRSSFQAYALSSAVSLIIVYPAIKYYGIEGGAAVFTIASLISMSYTLYEVWRYYNLETAQQSKTPSTFKSLKSL